MIKKPKSGEGISKKEWVLLTAGTNQKALNKINKMILKTLKDYNEYLLGPEIEEMDNGKKKIIFGESSTTVKIEEYFQGLLTISFEKHSSAPLAFNFESGNFESFDLLTGDRFDFSKNFKSAESKKIFMLKLWNYFSNEFEYHFPFYPGPSDFPIETIFHKYNYILTKSGIKIIVTNNSDRHYFKKEIGIIPYDELSKDWFNSKSQLEELTPKNIELEMPILKPQVNCKGKVEKIICDNGLKEKYLELLLLWESEIESFASLHDGFELNLENFKNFEDKIVNCGSFNKKCLEEVLDNKKKEFITH